MNLQIFASWHCMLFCFCFFQLSPVFSQTSFDDDKYSDLQLHIDKRYFIPGETVFFSVYDLSGDTTAGKSCTIVLVDEKNKIVESKRLLFSFSTAGSYFVLPVADAAKYYSLQYYITSYSKPQVHSRYIFSALSRPVAEQKNVAAPVVHFYPEGNSLVKGLPVVMFCRFDNIPFSIMPKEAAVVNTTGDTLGVFDITNKGCGRVELNEPSAEGLFVQYSYAGNNYKKEIPLSFSASAKTILNLYPVIDAFAYRIRTLVSDSFSIKVENEGAAYYSANIYLNKGDDFARQLKLSQLKPGVNIFYLLDAGKNEIAARAFIVDPAGTDTIRVNNADISGNDLAVRLNTKLSGNFSISVQRVSKRMVTEKMGETDRRQPDDTNLQTIRIDKINAMPFIEDSLRITLTDDKSNGIFANEPVNLMVRNRGDNFLVAKTTNTKGEVFVSSTVFPDSATVVFFPAEKEKNKGSITGTYKASPVFIDSTENDFSSLYPVLADHVLPENDITTLSLNTFKSKMLEEVVVRSKTTYKTRIDSVERAYASGIFMSKVHNLARYDLTADNSNQFFGDVASFLNGKIARRDYSSFKTSSALSGYNIYLNENLVDEMIASTINMSDVAFISVMDNSFLAFSSFGAAILIYTKKGNSNTAINRDGVKRNILKIRTYSSGTPYFNSMFDKTGFDDIYRNTYYWNDNIVLSDQSEIQIPLFAKPATAVRITIAGFDEDGNYISLQKDVDSKK